MRLALIGCGSFGANYVRDVGANPDATLAVVCDTDPAQLYRASEASGATALTSWEQALDAQNLDGVIIATPNYLHAPIALAAARRGLHVLTEKPMATTLADAREMVDVCRGEDVRLMVGLSSRYTRSFRAARDLVRSGVLGEPLLIANAYQYTLQPPQPERTWHTDARLLGGGALIQMGIHSIDRVCWFADREPSSVHALVRRAGGRWADNLALCAFDFGDELLGQIEVAGVASAHRNEMTVHLSKGQIIIKRNQVRWYDGEWHEETHVTDAVALEVSDFFGAIREGREPVCSGARALLAHEVCFAAYRSSAEGRPLRRASGEYI